MSETPAPARAGLPDAALAFVTLIWGTTFIVNAVTIDREPPVAYLALRFAAAALLLGALAARRRRSERIWRDGAVLGFLLAMGMGFQIVGQAQTTASKTAFITGLSVVLTPFFALARTRRMPGAGNLAGVALASAGFAALTWPAGGGPVGRGDLLVVGCAAFFAVYIVENAVRAPRHDPLRLTAIELAVVAAVLAAASAVLRVLPGSVPEAVLERRFLVPDREFLLAVAYMTVFATIVTFALQTWAQTRMSATHAAILFALEPVWAAIFAWLLLGERLGGRGWAGGSLVLAGILVSEIRPRAAPATT
jgi:drug/metabolite transporter (DMT)-like permease